MDDDTREFSILSMLYFAARKYKSIIKLVIVGLIVFALYKTGDVIIYNSKIVTTEEQQQEYDLKIAEYDKKVESYKESSEKYEEKITDLETHISESIMYNLDPENTYVYEKYYVVDTGYKIMPNMSYQNVNYTSTVGNLYISFMKSEDVLQKIASALDIEKKYLTELYTMKYSDGIITFKVYGENEEFCTKIIDVFEYYLSTTGTSISNSVCSHELENLTEYKYYCESSVVSDYINNKDNTLQSYKDSIESNEKAIETTLEEKENYIAEFNNNYVKQSVVKPAIKYGIIGAVIGLLASGMYYCCVYIFSDKVNNAKDLQERIKFELLSRLSNRTNENKILKLLSKWEERTNIVDIKECCQLAVNNIQGDKINPESVLVTGIVSEQRLNEFAEELKNQNLSKEILVGADLLNNAKTSELVNKADYVIEIVESGISKYSTLTAELERLNNINKKVGCIVIE